ncbi:MAG: hypothetical protein IPG71_11310 [bacterium]|nr:hypothetical protein [bacterium]
MKREIRFDQIANVLQSVMDNAERQEVTDVDTLMEADKRSRELARAAVTKLGAAQRVTVC